MCISIKIPSWKYFSILLLCLYIEKSKNGRFKNKNKIKASHERLCSQELTEIEALEILFWSEMICFFHDWYFAHFFGENVLWTHSYTFFHSNYKTLGMCNSFSLRFWLHLLWAYLNIFKFTSIETDLKIYNILDIFPKFVNLYKILEIYKKWRNAENSEKSKQTQGVLSHIQLRLSGSYLKFFLINVSLTSLFLILYLLSICLIKKSGVVWIQFLIHRILVVGNWDFSLWKSIRQKKDNNMN